MLLNVSWPITKVALRLEPKVDREFCSDGGGLLPGAFDAIETIAG